jgi:hypothetical protein
MFELIFKKYFKSSTIHVFLLSFLIFIVLNVIENVIHYNIGKFHDSNAIHFTNPSTTDWVQIILIMIVFAILQGAMTSYFNICKSSTWWAIRPNLLQQVPVPVPG